ncbi:MULTISPECIES: tyrosine-type recombinase/integrase [unclassified Caballeronia]|uniref:tyrosine-type recombinase/integrase n=1 Tax=unclassified Caballeronia TaxID=2646786 RepID=UPI00285F6554|nr:MULTISPECIES: tyrosine-type recombinase/integrase [unclassified Caballeronia]MDR5777715.1 tyrosine-type recombinase/integrase [Caballeronia sp. LZ002]MDR5798881.1 tyrosine-type recombinase/integrase [Caballeronia sp. LZ001]MDR5853156.1 tyrosine-type recombinase/integrase [Caballeronia sp. LZ003]
MRDHVRRNTHCDDRFGLDSFDSAISHRDAERTRQLVEAFYLEITSSPDYTTTIVQRWDCVRYFVQRLARQRAPSSRAWSSLSSALWAMGKIRQPRRGRIKFIRAIPASTLVDLLNAARPSSELNPFRGAPVQERNWLIVNLLLLAGLRRGELMLLETSSLRADVDIETRETAYWLDVTTTAEYDPRSSAPGMKTDHSHRQVPVSEDLAILIERYVSTYRYAAAEHGFLFTAVSGAPLSAESINKIFERLSKAIPLEALTQFIERTGGKERISPHDLRHTCATARYAVFMAHEPDRELTFQRMRAFFGWSDRSTMPGHYARAAIQEDLLRTWNQLFDARVRLLRGLPS